MSGPTVSVLMPVYNAERYLAAAVQSILDQTYRDFEFIIINDGSKDRSLEILQEFAKRDARIRLISRPNTGYIVALNEGLELAQADLLARMDADDICEPQRFELQVHRMQAEPELLALGSCALAIDDNDGLLGDYSVPLTHEQIEADHLQGLSGIHHPAAMLRTAAVKRVGGYRKELAPCEDYDLWLRLGEIGRLANLPELLLKKRLLVSGAVSTTLKRQHRLVQQILEDAWKRRGLPGEPKLNELTLRHRVDLYRQWGWMALRSGQLPVSRRYAAKAFLLQPLHRESWKLAFCSLRGR